MPVRRIPMNYRSLTGRMPVGGETRSIRFESSLERDFAILAELDEMFARIEEQPVRITYLAERGRTASYVPDFLVHYRDDARPPLLCEVKYAEDLARKADELRPRLEAAGRYARERDWVFQVMTEREIRTPRLDNAKFLERFRRGPADPGREARLLVRLADLGPTTVENLLAATWSGRDEGLRGLPFLWRLIAGHRVGVDLDARITMTSPVWPLWSVD